jgi:hypothetical protein
MIKTAAMSELQSEAISVEMAAYRQTTPSPIAVEVEQPALTKRQAEGLMVLAMGPGTMATPKYPKGRWER